MGKRMVIVGAGIAGLATGYYARVNGFETTILESQNGPGGLCAAWTRKGYTFDTSMHMLVSSRRGPFHRMWEELGIVGDRTFHYHDLLGVIEGREKRLSLYADRERLRSELHALSPSDRELSDEFVDLLCAQGINMTTTLRPRELLGPLDHLRAAAAALPMMRLFRRYGRTTVQEYSSRFQDPFLRQAVRFSVDSPGWPMPRFPLVALRGFASGAVKEAGVPVGGIQ